MIKANNSELRTWLDVNNDSDFPVQNIPFGIMQPRNDNPRPATRIGNTVIDLSALCDFGFFDKLGIPDLGVFNSQVLNDFIALGKPYWSSVRERISELFNIENDELQGIEEARKLALFPIEEVEIMMPVRVGDYTDFYSSIEHATNVGKMFRDPENALLPNWRHIPVAYHGRSSSIMLSGVEIHRPKGQTKDKDSGQPIFGPSRLLDFELEMAFVVGKTTNPGESIPVDQAEDAIFGMVLFNDLSARDIQTWEYVPLGPFLSKNFGSVISPWIVTLEALKPFRVEGPKQDPPVLPYLQYSGKKNFDISLDVFIKPGNGEETRVTRSNFKYMYWNMAQQLAHHTINGCNMNVGDMCASGTISGPTPNSYGSMLELSWRGKKPIKLKDGSKRKFLLDNDTVIMRGYAENEDVRVGFGEAVVKILPAT